MILALGQAVNSIKTDLELVWVLATLTVIHPTITLSSESYLVQERFCPLPRGAAAVLNRDVWKIAYIDKLEIVSTKLVRCQTNLVPNKFGTKIFWYQTSSVPNKLDVSIKTSIQTLLLSNRVATLRKELNLPLHQVGYKFYSIIIFSKII